jgi:hypothetical protein
LGGITEFLGAKKISIRKRVRIFPGFRIEAHGNNACYRHKKQRRNSLKYSYNCSIVGEGNTILGECFYY